MAALGLVHVQRREQDRHAATHDERVDDRPEVAPRDRVDARRRLVQQQYVGQVDQRADQRELLAHPARELAGRAIEKRSEAGHVEQARPVVLVLRARYPAEVAEELDILGHGERVVQVEPEALRHVADDGLDCLGLSDDVHAGYPSCSGVGLQHAGEDLQHARLAGTVGPDEPDHLAPSGRDRDPVHRPDAAAGVGPRQAASVDDHRRRVSGWARVRRVASGRSRRRACPA